MRFLRLDLLTLLISLFLFSNCRNKDSVGLPVTTGQVSGIELIDKNITVNTQIVDSVQTSGLTKTPLAYFKDPIFGTTEADIAAGVNLPNSGGYTLPVGTITTDSAVLVLRYTDGFYGDSLNSRYKINVYQLKEQPLSSTTYYSNKVWNYDGDNVIGSRSFKAFTHTTFKITDIVSGQPDTLKKVSPQLRVPISTAFINDKFFNASTSQLTYNSVFQQAIKGLYLNLDKTQSGDGGKIMFNLDSSRIDVYYKTVNGTIIDTSVVSLPLTPAVHAAQILHSYSSTVLNAINSKTSNNTMYLDGMGGTQAKISFNNLNTVFGTNDLTSVVLNRAELVITPTPGTYFTYVPQPKLSIYRNTIAGLRTTLPDATSGNPYFQSVGIFDGYYSSNLQSYHFIITGYIQGLMQGTFPDYGTYIVPIDTTNKNSVDVSPTAQSAGRVVAIGSDPNSAYSIKMNIIYTKRGQ